MEGHDRAASVQCDEMAKKLTKWRYQQRELFPSIDPLPDVSETPQDDNLLLPSSFDTAQRSRLSLEYFASIEKDLRLGQAYDLLSVLRGLLNWKSHQVNHKHIQLRGQGVLTQSQTKLQETLHKIRRTAKRYNHTYQALVRLGLEEDHELRELKDGELRVKYVGELPKQGESKEKNPWFWLVGKPDNKPTDEWSTECAMVLDFTDAVMY